MIITLSGKAGSGKSTIAKLLAKKLKLKHYSMGDLTRKYAAEKGMSIKEFSEYQIDHPSVDKKIDKYQKTLSKKEDNFIIDGRVSYFFVPNSIKVFLDATDNVAAKRIIKSKRKTELAKTIPELQQQIKQRRNAEIKRYKNLYNINPYEKKNYDLIINTTNLTISQVVDKVLKFIHKKKKTL